MIATIYFNVCKTSIIGERTFTLMRTILLTYAFIQISLHSIFAQNFGFTSAPLLYSPQVSVRSGSTLVPTDIHVFYIGINNKVCEYLWNGTTWTGGSQLDWSSNYVQNNTQICNNNNEIFFIRTSDNRICQLIWNGQWIASPISTTMIPVRSGTKLIYSDNVIYYVGNSSNPDLNNKVCYISRSGPSSPFTFNDKLAYGNSIDVKNNTQLVYVGPYVNSPSSHIYYVGGNDKICDIVRDNTMWIGSTGNLGGSAVPPVRAGSDIANIDPAVNS